MHTRPHASWIPAATRVNLRHRRRRGLQCLLLCGVVLGGAAGALQPVFAQDWAEKMFHKREHNFGTVARGADTVYRFEITNLYKQTMTITGVRSSCGCTSTTVENPTIKTHEKAYVVARFNTRAFTGMHGATLTVSFDAPYRAEVQVRVHGNIRGDVVFAPGAVQFGDVEEGVGSERALTVSYAGRENWRIVDVTNDNNHFEVELKELGRGRGKVSYNLLVRLRDNVPAGYVKDQLTVVTNDPRADSQRIPLFVEGRVMPEISVTPAMLVLGDITAGVSVTRKVVVRGKNPFRILNVDCGDDCFRFDTDDQSKTLHLVGVTFHPEGLGDIRLPVRIVTDRGSRRGTVLMISANVLPAAPAAPAESAPRTPSSAEQPAVDAAESRVADAASK